MSKHDFSAQEFADRLARVRAAIDAAGLDWLLVFHPVSIHWLAGADTKSYTSFQCLPVAAKPAPLTILTREMDRNEFEEDTLVDAVRGWNGREPEDPMEAFARFATDLGLHNARIGMEVPAFYLHPQHYVRIKAILGNALIAEPTNLIHDLKMVKSRQEIAYHRRSAEIACDAMDALLARIAEGCTELDLAAEAFHSLLGAGSGLPASTMNLVTGERSCFVLGAPTARKLQHGDPGHVELAAAYRRYTSTVGRTWSFGETTPRLRNLHDVIRRASDACIATIRDGVPTIAAHAAARQVIADAGLDQHRQHTTGYGMAPGFPPSWGEPVNMFGGNPYTLHAGMVVSVEPAVFIRQERLGVRMIDNVLVTETGAELLSRTRRELIVIER